MLAIWGRAAVDGGMMSAILKITINGYQPKKEMDDMIEPDTIKLLRECDAGIKMGVASIGGVLGHVSNSNFKRRLADCIQEHKMLDRELRGLLSQHHDEGKEPSPVAKGMSWMKTNMKLGLDGSDESIASLMTDGCNMGIKSLYQYLNEYQAASEEARDIAKRLIRLEELLSADIQKYL